MIPVDTHLNLFGMRQIVTAIKSKLEEQPLPESDLVSCLWQGLITSVEWSARQDQNEALAIREITVCVLHTYAIGFSLFM